MGPTFARRMIEGVMCGYAHRDCLQRDGKGHISPEDMVDFLILGMRMLIPRCKGIFFERIERMAISLDGVEKKKSWELATLEPEYTG